MDKKYKILKRISNKFIKGNIRNFSIEEYKLEIDERYTNNLKLEIADLENDKLLINTSRENKKNIDLLMCLRGRVSNAIIESAEKLGNKNDFFNTISFVLQDDGRRFHIEAIHDKEKWHNSKKLDRRAILLKRFPFNRKKKEKPFNYLHIEFLLRKYNKIDNLAKKLNKEAKNVNPFCAEIIHSYNPDKNANLQTWTFDKVKSHQEIRKYYRAMKSIIHISDWALLGKRPLNGLISAWKQYGDYREYNKNLKDVLKKNIDPKNKSIDDFIKNLLISYQLQYPKAKELYKYKTKKIKGWSPNNEFTRKLNPPLECIYPDLHLLELIADARRKYEQKKTLEIDKLENEEFKDILLNGDSDNEDYSDSYLAEYISLILKKELILAMKETILDSQKKWEKKPERRKAWIYFAQGYDYPNEIASKCKKDKSWVSKVIKLSSIVNNASQNVIEKHINEILKSDKSEHFFNQYESKYKYISELNFVFKADKMRLMKDIKVKFSKLNQDTDFIKNFQRKIFRLLVVKKTKEEKEAIMKIFNKIAYDILKDMKTL